MTPEIRFTRAYGDVNIAYQVFGDGPADLVIVPGWISNIETFWEEPTVARFFLSLSEFCRVILFDKRGTGLSDRVTLGATLEERMDDVRAVLDAADSEQASIFGYSEGGAMSVLFSTTYPERTRSLALMGSYARLAWASDYEIGRSEADQAALLKMIDEQWGTAMGLEGRIDSRLNDARFKTWWAKYLRNSASPAGARELQKMNYEIDVRPILNSVRVPALILNARGDKLVPMAHAEYLAKNIEDAQLQVVDAEDHVPWGDGAEKVVTELQNFIGSKSAAGPEDRVLKTIMFTDIVDSTQVATNLGDTQWSDLLLAHHEIVRQSLLIHRGEEVKTTGDGFHAHFDGPARAIQCAKAIVPAVEEIGLNVRIGLHTGECVRRGEELEGQAIHIAARVSGLAEAGAILISHTVRDLIAGSGIETIVRGTQSLKGVEGEWTICEVA